MALVNSLDNTRFIVNSSGTTNTAATLEFLKAISKYNGSVFTTNDKKVVKINKQYNYRPYTNTLTTNHVDAHSVASRSMFQEDILTSHKITEKKPTRYWGEVACYTGPSNWYGIAATVTDLPLGEKGYDNCIYASMHKKIDDNYEHWNLVGSCGGAIKTKSDVSKQAGRSLMYTNGRLSQAICSQNGVDGFAINGWSSGPQVGSALTSLTKRMGMDWDSAIVDEGRNLKGPAEDYSYWTRPLQIAIFRDNGKYFSPSDKAQFRVYLINEGELPAGQYSLRFNVTDGDGKYRKTIQKPDVTVKSGDVFSQTLASVEFTLSKQWRAGYVTIKGELLDDRGDVVAHGSEQILLSNPESFSKQLRGINATIYKWPSAEKAIRSADAQYSQYRPQYQSQQAPDVILAGEVPSIGDLQQMLEQVARGTKLVVQFSPVWAERLYECEVLSEPVTEWGCKQEGFWYGNGWGYLGKYIGSQSFFSGSVLGTNNWEPQGDPDGFYPLKTKHRCNVHGLWMARHDTMRVLMATVDIGDGQVVLNPSYKLHKDNVLASLIFYNILVSSS